MVPPWWRLPFGGPFAFGPLRSTRILERQSEEPAPHSENQSYDPFLVVSHGDCTAYVEVWNEPTFDGQREA